MKKSELKKLIREVITEQMSMQGLPPRMRVPGGLPPQGSSNRRTVITPTDKERRIFKAMGSPRTINAMVQEFKRIGINARQIDNIARQAMRIYGVGPNDPIGPGSAIPAIAWWVLKETIKIGGAFIVGYYFGS